MWALLFALTGTAQAVDWGRPKPYVQPRLSLGYVSVNGFGTVQGLGGLEGGVTIRDKDTPHWLSLSRASAVGIYGFTSGNLGGDLRVGSFIGPDGKLVRLLSGPDLFYSGYGDPADPIDYFLAWSPGLDLRTTALFKFAKTFQVSAHLTPGWAFDPRRAANPPPVFTHVGMGATAIVRTSSVGLVVGVERQINVAGTQDYLVLGAGI